MRSLGSTLTGGGGGGGGPYGEGGRALGCGAYGTYGATRRAVGHSGSSGCAYQQRLLGLGQ